MATLSSWTNDRLRLSASASGCLRRAMPFGRGMMYYVLRFWQRKGQPFWLGLVLCPTIGYIDYIYLKTINTKYNKIYILKRRNSFSPYPFSIYILKRNSPFFVHFVFSAFY